MIPGHGMLNLTFTDNSRGHYDYWKKEWDMECDWSLFPVKSPKEGDTNGSISSERRAAKE